MKITDIFPVLLEQHGKTYKPPTERSKGGFNKNEVYAILSEITGYSIVGLRNYLNPGAKPTSPSKLDELLAVLGFSSRKIYYPTPTETNVTSMAIAEMQALHADHLKELEKQPPEDMERYKNTVKEL
jgi:hypothetical protein